MQIVTEDGPGVSAGWVARALGKSEQSLEAMSWKPVGTGQVAASYRGLLSWRDGDGPKSIVVKCPSTDPTSRQTGKDHGLYAKEIAWYLQLREETQVRCPQCFGGRYDEETGDFALLLEDCAPAEQGDQLAGASVSDVRATIREAVHLHAPFFDKPLILENPLTGTSEEVIEQRIQLYAMFWPEFRKRYEGRLDPVLLEMGDDFAKRFEAYARREPSHYTLVHGDMRIDNVLFGGADGRPILLDWQTLAAGNPMTDIAYLIGTSLVDRKERSETERGLVEGYFAGLRDYGLAPDEETLWQDYRRQALSGWVMAVMSSMLVQRTERGDEMFAVMAERPGYQALELDSVACI